MKNLKILLLISFFNIFLFAAEADEEINTIEIDGTLYKINPSSLNISPYDEMIRDNAIIEEVVNLQGPTSITEEIQSEAETKESKTCNISANVGNAFPLTNIKF
mgnify:CR=1 FL=1